MKRSVTVKLQSSKEQEKILFRLAQVTVILWNKINYERLKQFKEFGKIGFSTIEREHATALRTGLVVQQSNNQQGKRRSLEKLLLPEQEDELRRLGKFGRLKIQFKGEYT